MNKKVSGLAGLATLLNQDQMQAMAKSRITDAPPPEWTPYTIAVTLKEDLLNPALQDRRSDMIRDAVNRAYELGKRNGAVGVVLVGEIAHEIYDRRSALLLPAAAAAIMEGAGMTELALNLDRVASVFNRCEITTTISDDNKGVHYKLTKKEL